VRRYWWIKRVAAFLVLAPLVVAALSFVVMSLWDALVPSLFSGPVIGFWQAVGFGIHLAETVQLSVTDSAPVSSPSLWLRATASRTECC
jgi:hypothetical protein